MKCSFHFRRNYPFECSFASIFVEVVCMFLGYKYQYVLCRMKCHPWETDCPICSVESFESSHYQEIFFIKMMTAWKWDW